MNQRKKLKIKNKIIKLIELLDEYNIHLDDQHELYLIHKLIQKYCNTWRNCPIEECYYEVKTDNMEN